jgi:hypothetical protein
MQPSAAASSRGRASRAAAPVPQAAEEKAFALEVLKMCGGSDIRALDFLLKGRYDTYGPKDGFPAVGESHLRNWRASAAKAEEGISDAGNSGRPQLLQPTTLAAIKAAIIRGIDTGQEVYSSLVRPLAIGIIEALGEVRERERKKKSLKFKNRKI